VLDLGVSLAVDLDRLELLRTERFAAVGQEIDVTHKPVGQSRQARAKHLFSDLGVGLVEASGYHSDVMIDVAGLQAVHHSLETACTTDAPCRLERRAQRDGIAVKLDFNVHQSPDQVAAT